MVTQSRMEGPWKHFGNMGVRSLPNTYHLPRLLPRLCPSPHSPATAVPLDLMVLHKFDMRCAYVPQVVSMYYAVWKLSLGVTTPIVCSLVSHEVGEDNSPRPSSEYTATVPTLINCNFNKQETSFPSRGFWSPLFHLAAITLSPMPRSYVSIPSPSPKRLHCVVPQPRLGSS